jgi:hypothetical protein
MQLLAFFDGAIGIIFSHQVFVKPKIGGYELQHLKWHNDCVILRTNHRRMIIGISSFLQCFNETSQTKRRL